MVLGFLRRNAETPKEGKRVLTVNLHLGNLNADKHPNSKSHGNKPWFSLGQFFC
jgi:hypothetical protein